MNKRICLAVLIGVFFLSVTAVAGDTLLDETITVNKDAMRGWSISFSSGTKYSVEVDVTSGGSIDLLMMDNANYNIYEGWYDGTSSQSIELYTAGTSKNIKSKTYDFTPSEDMTVYVIIENANMIDGGASATGSVDVLVKITSDSTAPGFEIIPFILAVPILLIVWRKRRQ